MAVSNEHHHQQPHQDTAFADPIGNGQECALCPICVVLQALSTSRPEVTDHLVAAGRELTRALITLLEAHEGRGQRQEQRLQRIPVD